VVEKRNAYETLVWKAEETRSLELGAEERKMLKRIREERAWTKFV
jgi:hypothetical protein